MHLKRIKLYGFKSFADRTELELDPKLLAIVGPNGCGKSNIVDSILWALGEHNPRALRAATASDVIFSGSHQRKGLGYAEVQLTFDNEDGGVPIPAAEVVVTRRVQLDGEGEYLINSKSCRQKDIVDLFADTGLGRTGYAIVSQQEIDAVLTAHPEQRRLLIDEAAGVQKFRARKADTLKRLETATQHLRRAQDLVDEIERQIDPLEEQAMAARAYKKARARLDELELGLWLRDLVHLNEALALLDQQLAAAAEDTRKLDRTLAEKERAANKIAESVAEADKELDHRRSLHQGAFTGQERAESAVELLGERLKSLAALLANEEKRAQAATEERVRISEDRETARGRVAEIKAELDGLSVVDGEQAGELRSALAKRRSDLSAARQAQLLAHQREVEHQQAVLGLCRLREEAATLHRRSEELSASCTLLNAKAEEAQVNAETLERDLEELKEQMERSRERVGRLQSDKAEAEQALSAIRARIETLTASMPGDAASALLASGRLSVQRLASHIKVTEENRAAIDAALGSLSGVLVAENMAEGEATVRELLAMNLGRGAVIAEPPVLEDGPLNGALRAAKLVTTTPQLQPVVDALLANVLVADTLDAARDLAAKSAGWRRIVTRTGEVLHPSGACEVGPDRGRIAIESELAELAAEREQFSGRRDETLSQLVEAEKEAQALLARLREAEPLMRASRAEVSGAVSELEAARQQHRFIVGRIEEIEARILDTGEEIPDQQDKPTEEDIEAIESEVSEIERQLATIEAARQRGADERRFVEARLTDEQERLNRLEARIASSRASEEADRQRLMDLARQLEKAEADKESADVARQNAVATRQTADDDFERARLHRAALLEQSFEVAETVKSLRQERDRLTERSHGLDLERAKADIRRAQLVKSLAEEKEISMQRALELAETIQLPAEAAAEAGALRREIRRLGDVNLGAMEALESLGARRDDMIAQRDDLLDAQQKLLDAMKDIEQATLERFMETFEAVQREFGAVFGKLFEGGEGSVRLSDPDHVMTSGIEIEVQLPGKKRQRMELLSGGERSLTALAFLFSLLEVKPSPICILDEVDAALDGRNVERFCSLLMEFAEKMQFLVVTHNAVTIEAAHIWYGVTMQEPGVSTVIPFGQGARAIVETVAEATV